MVLATAVAAACTAALTAGPGMAAADAARAPLAAAPAAPVAEPADDFETFFQDFLGQRLDSSRVAAVSDLTLERDAARFTLAEGELWLTTPVAGRVCAAVFVGRGSFTLAPPNGVERRQMERVQGAPTLERPFSALVLVFADTTLPELERRLAFRPGGGSKAGSTVLGDCFRYVSEPKSRAIKASLARPFLEGRATGYLFSLIESVGSERLFFEIDPERVEEVTLWREPKSRHIGLWRIWRRDDVCMFPLGGARDSVPEGDAYPALEVERYRLESRIEGNMDFSATAELDCRSGRPVPQRWVALTLYDRLTVDSVAWVGGPGAAFFRGRENEQLWVRCDPPLEPGERRTLRVHYQGRLIERVGDWMLLGSSTGWYPRPAGRHRVPFELVFHHPSQYHLVSIGRRASSETRGRVTTSRWVSERPTVNASFVLGLFDEQPFGVPDAPAVTALMFRGRPEPIQMSFGGVKVVSGARMDKRVATDAARAVAFFHRVLGPPPVDTIIVAEIPDTGGEAFPGLIQITWTPFWGRNVAAEDAVFRAHEVAHQWWGHGVTFRSYHDHWLSEGFADFSGLWYVQQGPGGTKNYLAVLEAWREEILEDARFRPKDSPPAGPLWLGYRAASVEAPGDHALIIYKKGAWVLHMLRNMLLDSETRDDARFAAMMRDFYARHLGTAATTEDFRRVVERYAGEDLGWFFDQWVYGTEVPTYRFASRTERTEDGRYRVTCRVEQTGVPGSFRMPVPIRVDFEGDRFAWVRVLVEGPLSEFELPLMELEPRAVTFNDLQSVLCRVEEVRW